MKRLLPVGIQDFETIRTEGYCYVDKTAILHPLITGSSRAFFLSRPRRFGKSLLCSTLEAVFEGRRELFREVAGYPALAIDSLEWDWKKYPVIRLDLNAAVYSRGIEHLNSLLHNSLNNTARSCGIELRGSFVVEQFANLILDLRDRSGEKVVVIIDEYDKPLLETIGKGALHEAMRDELKGFYSPDRSQD